MIGGRGTMGLIGEYLHVIRNKIWIMLICLAAVMGVTAYITFRQPEVFEATCKIMYKKGRPASALTPGSPQYLFSPYFDTVTFETERHVIKGESVAAAVVERLDLAGGDAARKAWIDRVKNSISVSKEKDSRIYLITARGPDPRLVRDLANTVAEVYIALSLGEKKDSARKTLTLLTAQLEEIKNQIKKSRLAMIDYIRRQRG